MEDHPEMLYYEGTEYTKQEASDLVHWLSSPAFELLNRRFTQIRNETIDLMDSGAVSMKDAEELVRASAMRYLITDIKTMKDGLLQILEDDKPKTLDTEL